MGDYTRKLACALNKETLATKIISINDRRLKAEKWLGLQDDAEGQVEVLRLSSTLPWNIRIQKVKDFIKQFNPEWISLQYVPFGFHLKGLPFNLGNKLAQTTEHKLWHIMFHELSVNKEESLKFRFWSFLQVHIIKSLLRKLKPKIINTNTELYKYRLKEIGYSATVLPLFSNIGRLAVNNKESFEQIIPPFISKYSQNFIIGTLFGNFDYKRWDMRSLLKKISAYSFSKKRVVIASIGRMSAGKQCWEQLKKDFPQIVFIGLGEQSPEFISHWLNDYTDFGILTTLPELAGKSGSFMAFKEHGVPVVCKEKTESLAALNLPVEDGLIEVSSRGQFTLPARQQPVLQLQKVADMFIKELSMEDNKMQVAYKVINE